MHLPGVVLNDPSWAPRVRLQLRCAALLVVAGLWFLANPLFAAGSQRPEIQGEPQVRTVAEGLALPWAVAFLPDGSGLVTERDTGKVKKVTSSGEVSEVATIEGVVSGGEGGLLGIALSPEFETDHFVYLYYTTGSDNRIVRAKYENDQLGEQEVILEGIAKGPRHNGGRIAFGPDKMLYVGTGDAGDGSHSQNQNSLNGKILRLNLDGSAPADNPLREEGDDGKPQSLVWSYGHRNAQGLAWDASGRMYASELGESSQDEVNIIEKGKNYGWPEVEGSGGREGMIDPIVTWTPAEASPSGAAVHGGSLWVAALRGQRLWRIPLREDGSAEDPEALFVNEYGRLRAVTPAPDGSLWLLTSNGEGDKILALTFGDEEGSTTSSTAPEGSSSSTGEDDSTTTTGEECETTTTASTGSTVTTGPTTTVATTTGDPVYTIEDPNLGDPQVATFGGQDDDGRLGQENEEDSTTTAASESGEGDADDSTTTTTAPDGDRCQPSTTAPSSTTTTAPSSTTTACPSSTTTPVPTVTIEPPDLDSSTTSTTTTAPEDGDDSTTTTTAPGGGGDIVPCESTTTTEPSTTTTEPTTTTVCPTTTTTAPGDGSTSSITLPGSTTTPTSRPTTTTASTTTTTAAVRRSWAADGNSSTTTTSSTAPSSTSSTAPSSTDTSSTTSSSTTSTTNPACTTTTAPSSTTSLTPSTQPTTTEDRGLAYTGSDVSWQVVLGVGLVLAGILLVVSTHLYQQPATASATTPSQANGASSTTSSPSTIFSTWKKTYFGEYDDPR